MQKILVNKIKCKKCGDVVESETQYDFKYCKCGCVAVDGGKKYLKRHFTNSPDDFIDLSVNKKICKYNFTYFLHFLLV